MNKIDVYMLQIKDFTYNPAYLKFVSEARGKKISETTHAGLIKQHVITDLMIYYILSLHEGKKSLQLTYDHYGKPSYHPLYTISISHSDDYVAVALSKENVGLDIQIMKEKYLKLSKRILAVDEKQYLEKSADKLTTFFTFWTAKESFSKFMGTGVVVPMNQMIVSNKHISFEHWHVSYQNFVFNDLNMTVTYQDAARIYLHQLEINEVLEGLK